VIDAANDVINSIDREELARFFALKNDPEDEDAEVLFLATKTCNCVVIY
jgi:hypothetical protein